MTKMLKGARIKMEEFRTDVLFRTRNLGQNFFDISKKIISVINKMTIIKNHFEVFILTSKTQGNGIIESKVGLHSIKTSSHIFAS
jgi:hypothetical protein